MCSQTKDKPVGEFADDVGVAYPTNHSNEDEMRTTEPDEQGFRL
jgi:hypothetical protein